MRCCKSRMPTEHNRLIETGFRRHEPAYIIKSRTSQRRCNLRPGHSAIDRYIVIAFPFAVLLLRDIKMQRVLPVVNPIPHLVDNPSVPMIRVEGWPFPRGSL